MKKIMLGLCIGLLVGSLLGNLYGIYKTTQVCQIILKDMIPVKGYSKCCNSKSHLFPIGYDLIKGKKTYKLSRILICDRCHMECKEFW